MRSTALRFFVAFGSSTAGAILAAAPRDWIERYLGFDPDFASGTMESLVAALLLILGIALFASIMLRVKRSADQLSP